MCDLEQKVQTTMMNARTSIAWTTALPALIYGLISSPILLAVFLASSPVFVPHVAHASNGQCVWEGGPGAPTYPSCVVEDCQGVAGGKAICTTPEIRPQAGQTDQTTDSQKWFYTLGTGYWTDYIYFTGGMTESNDTAAVAAMTAGMNAKFSSCGGASISYNSGWGAQGVTGLWPGPPISQYGQLVADHYVLGYSACGSGPYYTEILRTRQFPCTAGSSRVTSTGVLQCVILPECCQVKKFGDPVSPVTGGNIYSYTDYKAGGAGGLEFTRYYNSKSRYSNPSTGALIAQPSDYWRFSYQRRLQPVAGNSGFTGIVQREDGTVEGFDGAGNEMLNRSGAADRLVNNGSGWTLTRGNGDVESYDASGNFLQVAARDGKVISVSYDTQGRMSQISDSFGHTLTIGYNNNYGQISQMTLPDGQSTINYSYALFNGDPSIPLPGPLISVSYADGTSISYRYWDPNNSFLLTGVVDESGTTYQSFSYDSQGNEIQQSQAGGVSQYQIAYANENGLLVPSFSDPMGQLHYYYLSNIAGVYKPIQSTGYCPTCANVTQESYDANGNLSAESDLDGHQTQYTFDQTRNLEISRTEGLSNGQTTAATRTIATQWHPTLRLPTQVSVYSGARATGTPLSTTAYSYDGYGNVLTKSVTDGASGASRTWTYTYYNSGLYGQVHTAKGPRTDVNDTMTYAYYSCTTGAQCGQVQSVSDALGHTATFTSYNANGQPTSVTDPNGVVTILTYDARQRLTSSTVGSETTSYSFYPTGLLQKATLPDGSYVSYIYDGAHRLIEVDDATGDRLVYTLDGAGNRIQEQRYDPSGTLTRAQSHVFNNMGLAWQDLTSAGSDSQASVYSYDAQGNLIGITGPLNRNSTESYDSLNRIIQQTNPANGTVQNSWDANDNLVSVKDPLGLTTQYTYNGLGDLTRLQSPDTGTTQFAADSAGNVHTVTDGRGATAQYSYDALNRLTGIQYSDQGVQFTYDQGTNGIGHLTSIADGSGQTSFAYDTHGRVTQKIQSVGATSLSVAYTYQNGDLAAMTTPSGQAIAYTYNASGRLSGVSVNGTVVLNQVQYNAYGPAIAWTWGNGTISSRAYTLDGWLAQIVSAGTSTYTFNDDGSISSRSDDVERDYSVVAGTTTVSAALGANRTASTTGALVRTYQYDGAGNTTSNGTITYAYNGANRMISAAGGIAPASFSVNALGQRVSKSSAGVTTLFAYDEAGHLIGEYSSSGQLIQETVWMADNPVATLRPNASGGIDIFYVHTDHLNSPRRVTRASDNVVVWTWSSDPFGNGFVDQDPDGDGQAFVYNLRFAGQYYDPETGLNYNYMRDYDPAVGRYIESDPIGLAGGSYSTYNYAYGDPINNVDPFGLAPPVPAGVFPAGVRPPPLNVPGGPWSWAPNSQNPRGGVFVGPKPAKGPRTTCTYTPPGPEHPDPYWKVTAPSGAEQRYNQFGELVTPYQAHPGSRISLADNPWLFLLYSLVHSDPAY